MDKPLSTEDLYGKSAGAEQAETKGAPLTYEETPEIDPIPAQNESPSTPPYTSRPPQKGSAGKTLGILIVFIVLFVAGIWLSSSLRNILPKTITDSLPLPKTTTTPTPTVRGTTPNISPTPSSLSSWSPYTVIAGQSKIPFEGVTIRIPDSILTPVCDTSSCVSQGTYLPGGTRLTIAPRGTGQQLKDYRGSTISDVNGITFTTKERSVAGKNGIEFTGVFTGRTISGYAFSKMRGVMIPLSDSTSIEINHFTPSGIIADFDADDALFDQIVATITFTGSQTQKGAVLSTPTPIIQ